MIIEQYDSQKEIYKIINIILANPKRNGIKKRTPDALNFLYEELPLNYILKCIVEVRHESNTSKMNG